MFNPFTRRDRRHQYSDRPVPIVPNPDQAPRITGKLDHTLDYINQTAGQSDDFVVTQTVVAKRKAVVCFYQSLIDNKQVEKVLEALMTHDYPRVSLKALPFYLAENVIPLGNLKFIHNLWELREALTSGLIIVLVDGIAVAIAMSAQMVPHRAVEPPLLESSTRGPQIAFIEDIDVNIGLMRKSLCSDALTIKELRVGFRSRTRVALLYQYDVANPALVSTAIKRIEAVHVDKLTGGATLEQRIIDNHWTLFPLTRATSRLDNCVKEVGQGKVLLLVDGDPTAILIPGTVTDFFQTMEDDQHSWVEATFVRWLRYVSFGLALLLPALYISFVDFNPELMPQTLAIQIARSREGVPFNAATEVMMMQLVIEIIREAALRMPKVMGQTIGIVGGLVLGQAAVEAGLVSNILIVIIALTAVSVFVVPSFEFSTVLRLLSWMNILCSTLFGFYGLVLAVILVLFHLGSLKSFGVPYLEPLAGEHLRDYFIDGVLRLPLAMIDKRTAHYHVTDTTRAADYTDPVKHVDLQNNREPMSQPQRDRS